MRPPPEVSAVLGREAVAGSPGGALWVSGLPARGRLGFTAHAAQERVKLPWFRRRPGRLRIEGRRLDAPAPPLGWHVPEGYGPAGFQPGSVVFPTPGCWEVVGRLEGPEGQGPEGSDAVRLVVLVVPPVA
jgi:hypothetical protein